MDNTFLETLEAEFVANANPRIAGEQKAYMRGQFEYYGLKSPDRRALTKPFLERAYLPPKTDLHPLVLDLWARPQREYHYFAMELAEKFKRSFEKEDLALFEHMILHHSWWDTTDFIAPKLIGQVLKLHPELRDEAISRWLASENIWLQRSAIIFQVKYKEELDTDCLSFVINSLLGSKEFFINKAIGWMLRYYGRVNPQWVLQFAEQTDLAPLSRREGLRLLK